MTLSDQDKQNLRDALEQHRSHTNPERTSAFDPTDDELWNYAERVRYASHRAGSQPTLHIVKDGGLYCDTVFTHEPREVSERSELPLRYKWCQNCKNKYSP